MPKQNMGNIHNDIFNPEINPYETDFLTKALKPYSGVRVIHK